MKQNVMGDIQNIHCVGVGGCGMGGIAEVLHQLGYTITGSDLTSNAMTQRLKSLGLTIYQGHQADYVQGVDVVIQSTAVDNTNVEIEAARAERIPVIPRALMLAELMRFRYGIAVTGTHGKTTTTSLITALLAQAGMDPTYVIGGRLGNTGQHAQLGSGEYFVAEADESDASFLYLQPQLAVVTNIDYDHMGTYRNDFKQLQQSMLDFVHHVPFYGKAVVCIDDPTVRKLMPQISRRVITYGFSEDADFRALSYKQQGLQSHFEVKAQALGAEPIAFCLNFPGQHNVLNALAAIAVASECGVSIDAIAQGLLKFGGVGRRFDILGDVAVDGGEVTVIDDYGHHPKECACTLETMRQVWPDRRCVVIFQPHRYTRLNDLFSDFVQALAAPDLTLILDVYTAGEEPIAGINSASLCEAIRQTHHHEAIHVPASDDLNVLLHQHLKPGDVVLFQGAGTVTRMAAGFVGQTP